MLTCCVDSLQKGNAMQKVSYHLQNLLKVISAAVAAGLLQELTFGVPDSPGPIKAVVRLYVIGFEPEGDHLFLGVTPEAQPHGENTLSLSELETVIPVGTSFMLGEQVTATIKVEYISGGSQQTVHVAKIVA